VSIATQKGDKGTTGLLYGGRVRKDSARIDCNGAVDEAQAAIGYARAVARANAVSGAKWSSDMDAVLVGIERDLWVLMAEVATPPTSRRKLVAGTSLVTAGMVEALTERVHDLESQQILPTDFVVPGGDLVSASLDVARTVVRRAERLAVTVELPPTSFVVPYLNRLSDLCWLLGRAAESEHLTARQGPRSSSKRNTQDAVRSRR
jgi:cob(I)alamin adenosyltransferase